MTTLVVSDSERGILDLSLQNICGKAITRKPDFVACEHQSRKPAWTSEQSDQHFCYSQSEQ